jgi:hypothetical protein
MDSATTVYLNTADLETLSGVRSIGRARAEALIEARPFQDWSDLKRVGSFDQDAINALKSEGVQLGEAASGPINEPGSGGSAKSPSGNMGRA